MKQTQALEAKNAPAGKQEHFWLLEVATAISQIRLDYLLNRHVTFLLNIFICKENEYVRNRLFWLV